MTLCKSTSQEIIILVDNAIMKVPTLNRCKAKYHILNLMDKVITYISPETFFIDMSILIMSPQLHIIIFK